MTLIEAIKTGLSFKRPAYQHWYSTFYSRGFSTEDVLANDWETKPPEKKMKKVKVWQWRSEPYKDSYGWCITQTDFYSEYGYDGWTRIESSMIEIEVPEDEV